MGRAFTNSLINQDLYGAFEQAFKELGLNLADISEQEADPALGNGGLGRLAACFGFIGNFARACGGLRHSLPIRHVQTRNCGRQTN